jgi:hypothetical protein
MTLPDILARAHDAVRDARAVSASTGQLPCLIALYIALGDTHSVVYVLLFLLFPHGAFHHIHSNSLSLIASQLSDLEPPR